MESPKDKQTSPNQKKPEQPDKNAPNKNLIVTAVVLLVGIIFIYMFTSQENTKSQLYYSEFLQLLDDPNITWEEIQIYERRIVGNFILDPTRMENPNEFNLYQSKYKAYKLETNTLSNRPAYQIQTYSPSPLDSETIEKLYKLGISFQAQPEKENYFLTILINSLPWILILGVLWYLLFRQVQGTGNRAMSFGRSRARLVQNDKRKITFSDVAGVEEAKQELMETVEFLKYPEKFRKLGAKIPRGILLVGPPGTGKTLLARSVAGEADRPFFSMSGSEFVEMFVGVGASRVRDLFEKGKKHAPCILFIDELDAVGRVRGAGYGGGHDEREQTLNQMLVEMDGFESEETLIVMAATNRPDVLDPALLRPGRFDRRVIVHTPDMKGRKAILSIHMKNVPYAKSVNTEVIAKGTPGFSGADLANLVNEAALVAARKSKRKIQMSDLEYAKDKVLMGPERKTLLISEKEKTNTAYHEAGHALLSFLLPRVNILHKVSIIPRGNALGVTQTLPTEERMTMPREYLLEQMMVLFGGRIGEEYKFGANHITTGASSDIEKATRLARSMVCEWGMSEKLGPISFGQKDEPIFLGKEIARHKDYSEKTAEMIDQEVKTLIEQSFQSAKKMIQENINKLEALAQALLVKEVLDRREIEELLQKA